MAKKTPELLSYVAELREEWLKWWTIIRAIMDKYNIKYREVNKFILNVLENLIFELRWKWLNNKEIYKYISNKYFNEQMPDIIRNRLYKLWIKFSPTHNIKQWDVFNYLTIIKEVPSITYWKKKYRAFECKCKCWNIITTTLESLIKGKTLSCWCYHKEKVKEIWYKNKIHWMSKTRFWWIFQSIKWRCNYKKNISYPNYWWRWIKCEWKSFKEFKNDMYDSYIKHIQIFWEKNTTIERIDNNWNYCKSNCRWATIKEQANNRRTCVFITYNWITKTITQWAEYLWISYSKLRKKLNKWILLWDLINNK